MLSSAPSAPSSRLRVLLVSESCDPEGRQSALIGWSQAEALRERVDLHIVTEASCRDSLIRAGLVEGRDFTTIDLRGLKRIRESIRDALFGHGKERGWGFWQALTLPVHLAFEWRVWRRFGGDLSAARYDLVHRITPISPDHPSLLAARMSKLKLPLVVGPLNGGLAWPPGYGEVRRAEGEWMSYLRGMTRFVPGLRALRARANALLLGSFDMLNRNDSEFAPQTVYMPENGIDRRRFSAERTRKAELPLRIVFLGRLVPFKGPDLVIEAAAAMLADGRAKLRIVGAGPMSEGLAEQAERLGVSLAVTLVGDVDHARVQEELVDADLMCSLSIREFGGAVIMEAMYMGAVPVVVDYGGPPEYIDEGCGFKIPLGSREEIIAELKATLESIAREPERLHAMSVLAQEHARVLFDWKSKAAMIERIYDWVLTPGSHKPDFGIPLNVEKVTTELDASDPRIFRSELSKRFRRR